MFQAKPLTFQLESSRVAFATLYLQGIAFDHYTALLRFDPNSLVLSNWQAFAQEFSSKFGVFDTIAEVEENLFNLQMRNNGRFTIFIIQFEKEAYKTGWNYNALRFATMYQGHPPPRLQAAQLQWLQGPCHPDCQYWEDCTNINRPLGPCPQMQLNTADTQEAPDPNPANPNLPTDSHNTPDYTNNEEALCANRFRNWPWIDIPEETQEKQQFLPDPSPPHHPPTLLHPGQSLIDSGATNNFINESLATLVATPQKLPLPIRLTLFNGSSTSTSNITHYMQTTLAFANG
ncbi:hypothetical protein C0993_011203 [Termitomyces sp. T159_Od127]|nr:hypothetical protein C0993_011203 [Termitomyces sp. T159_Od127]